MKKIKLLLLGIVSIFGIGLSFGQSIINFSSYFTNGELISNGFTVSPGVNHFSFTNKCIITQYIDYSPTFGYSVDGETYIDTSDLRVLMCGDVYINNYNSSNYSISYWEFPFVSSYSSLLSFYSDSTIGIIYPPEGNSQLEFLNSNTCSYLSWSYGDNTMSFYSDPLYSDLLGFNIGYDQFVCGDIYINNTYQRGNSSLFYSFYTGFYYNGGSSGSNDITTPIIPVDGSPYDIMGLYIRQYVLCKMTSGHLYSGAVGSCDGFQREEFFQGHSTMIYDNGSSIRMSIYSGDWFLSNYCSSISNSFTVPFCSQLDLYQDSQVDYILYKDTWDLRMFILGSGFNLEASFSSGGLISTQCFGVWCPDYVSTGDFQFVPETGQNDNVFSGYIVDSSFYDFSKSDKIFFNCPYPYSGSYIVIAQNLIDGLGGVDILKPLNCFISAFSYGTKTLYFGDLNSMHSYRSGSLISGDSYGHKVLYSFFDLLLSIGIIVILTRLFKF